MLLDLLAGGVVLENDDILCGSRGSISVMHLLYGG